MKFIYHLIVLCWCILSVNSAQADLAAKLTANLSLTAEQEQAWLSRLKNFYFPDKDISWDESVISLQAPLRAEDGALVPIRIQAGFPQTTERYVQSLSIIIDNNPNPLAGKFRLTPLLAQANLDLLIRVDAYSPVRVIAETNDGKLYMTGRYVKASGGCSAPPPTKIDEKRIGDMRFSTKVAASQSTQATRLSIVHPNLSGLQRDQVSTLPIPPRYIKAIEVKLDNQLVFSAETDISISENPDFQFYLSSGKSGILSAIITDTDGQTFTHQQKIESSGVQMDVSAATS
ncbi:quinoprotein dehydrogenase-associated SoxYZ-like carrier [uncultured Thiothrix sp.]|uniref:quinoprotein dehydrogenase-associated SoxYZ-like carrier n=1 Tax=uncultured Thiothrix sp. TaxID=223185 RepID=UPI0026388CB2|nr:quinoprotein dehydrogenase-associated SoxYZ-like carrier [uncultured Thiothrix sp.]HMT93553.1 quinoprotein dehydrogenase-associated SoxYZ-like carrier [Thiolinea sp.]